MAAANGLMFSAAVQGVLVPNTVPLNLFEIIANQNVAVLIHSIRIEFVPMIIQGKQYDSRAGLFFDTLAAAGTGGTYISPAAEHPRNTSPSVTVINCLVTSPGVSTKVRSASNPSTIVPVERLFAQDQRIRIPAGTCFGIGLSMPFNAPYSMSAEIYFEES